MEVTYHLFDPTGNITLLVETPVPAEERLSVAAAVLNRKRVSERVGGVCAL